MQIVSLGKSKKKIWKKKKNIIDLPSAEFAHSLLSVKMSVELMCNSVRSML